MARAVALYCGENNVRIQVGVRKDGVMFRRHQAKTTWGRQWTEWRKSGRRPPVGKGEKPEPCISGGVCILSLAVATPSRPAPTVWLPND